MNARDERLVTGFTRHVCITHDGLPARLPPALADVVARVNANEESCQKSG
ncbi:MAG: hypothetical protein GXP37_02300 [Chloroflexi bacterium]|nr:hypothetical protein [Chloroflexota bacterium]